MTRGVGHLQPPTVLALFRRPRYGAGALRDGAHAPETDAALVVTAEPPTAGPLDLVSGLLGRAQDAGSGRAPWLTGLDALHERLRDQGRHVLAHGLGQGGVVEDLSRVVFPGMPGAVAFGTVDAEDLFHSLVLVAPAGTRLTLWNERGRSPRQGAVQVTLGDSGLVEVEDLDLLCTAHRVGDARVEVLAAPAGEYAVSSSMSWPGGLVPRVHRVTGFAGETSSLQLEVAR